MDPRFNIISSLSTKVKKRELQGETNKDQKLYLLQKKIELEGIS